MCLGNCWKWLIRFPRCSFYKLPNLISAVISVPYQCTYPLSPPVTCVTLPKGGHPDPWPVTIKIHHGACRAVFSAIICFDPNSFCFWQRILWSPHIKLWVLWCIKKSLNKSLLIWFQCDTMLGFINLVSLNAVIGRLWYALRFQGFDQEGVLMQGQCG